MQRPELDEGGDHIEKVLAACRPVWRKGRIRREHSHAERRVAVFLAPLDSNFVAIIDARHTAEREEHEMRYLVKLRLAFNLSHMHRESSQCKAAGRMHTSSANGSP